MSNMTFKSLFLSFKELKFFNYFKKDNCIFLSEVNSKDITAMEHLIEVGYLYKDFPENKHNEIRICIDISNPVVIGMLGMMRKVKK